MALVSIDLTRLSEQDLIDLNRRIVERLRLIRSARQLVQLARFTVGVQVEFATDDGRIVRGAITKLNRKTATVCCNTSGHWHVTDGITPYNQVRRTKCDDNQARADQAPWVVAGRTRRSHKGQFQGPSTKIHNRGRKAENHKSLCDTS